MASTGREELALLLAEAAAYVQERYGQTLYWPYKTPPTRELLDDAFAAVRTENGTAAKSELPDTYEMDVIRQTFTEALFDAFIGYASGGAVTKWRNAAGRAVIEGHSSAFYRGYDEAGAEETEPDDERWLTTRQKEQVEFLAGVFEWIKEQRDAETVTEDAIRARVEQWAQALDATFGEGKLRGNKSQVLVWHLGETEDHCTTCARLDGQRHKAQWYLDRDYLPGKAGAAMLCGGYRCGCYLTTKAGETVTI
jgi:hypothetical protein